jgi:inositol oxygenase
MSEIVEKAHEDLPFHHKSLEEFRNYVDSDRQEVVRNHYNMMRQNQTVEFVKRMHEKYTFERPRALMTIKEAFEELKCYVDSSDPDTSLPNLVHMLQTAEGIRLAGHPDWMQLVGLIHDMGKLMFLWGTAADGQQGTATGPQWALGGDTWVVGCKIPSCTVFPEFNDLNPDMNDERYNSDLGIYSSGCGLDNVLFAYGHDEYLYQMLIANGAKIPSEGLAMVRYHSAYPWHTGGAYRQFMTEHDFEMMKWVLEFNKYDLYTKDNKGLDEPVEVLWEYYQSLIDKYLPGKLK